MQLLAIILPILLAGLSFIALLKLVGKERFSYPLDMGLTYRGKRILGDNKTLKGPVVMSFFTGLYGLLLVTKFKLDSAFGFSGQYIFYYYSLVGFMYSLGELPNSFLKRQLSIPPGGISKKKMERYLFILLDTFDSLLACSIVYFLLFKFPVYAILISILIGGCLHLLTDRLMIVLRLKTRNQ